MTYTLTTAQITLLVTLALWELLWKGIALWRAAHRNQRGWFIALLVINSIGILPVLYLVLTDLRVDDTDGALNSVNDAASPGN